MINGKKVLGLIPARGGSKGVPRKNVRPVGGKPLIAWTIEAGRGSRCLDRLVLSSDDDEIIETAKRFGCDVPFRRPPALALDTSPGIDPVLHALDQLPGYDYLVLLQPTSPLRTAVDIDACIERCEKTGAPTCVSVTKSSESPFWTYFMKDADELRPVVPVDALATRRQDLPATFVINGAVYVGRPELLRKGRTFLPTGAIGYEMPAARSIDLDTEDDFQLLEFLFQRGQLG